MGVEVIVLLVILSFSTIFVAILAGVQLHRLVVAKFSHMGFHEKYLIHFILLLLLSVILQSLVVWFARMLWGSEFYVVSKTRGSESI